MESTRCDVSGAKIFERRVASLYGAAVPDGFMDGGMRRPRRFPPFTMALIAVNVVIYFTTEWIHWHSQIPVDYYFALQKEGLQQGHVWQLITFQFLHAHLSHPLSWMTLTRFDLPWHLLLNCWAIFVFGPSLEATLGKWRLATLYLLSGIAGGALQVFASVLSYERFGGPVVGASAGVFGLVAAFTSLFPDARMTVLLFFVIPVRMTANRMLTVAGVLTVLGIMFPNRLLGAHVAHMAHLGGLIAGLIIVRSFLRRYRHWQH
jgi:membrane associated rhomboid family serine protease